ncbi:MAG: dihydroneopterin aldolase [Hydrogenimonas sp.]|nr:MAG: dihydroneopterin aldolase [Hydrogenimonas sp.]
MRISIQDLHFEAIIGILDFERTTPQPIEVHCEIDYCYNPTQKEFLDYAKVASLIESTIQKEQFFLIEEALEALFSLLKNQFPQIEMIKITICKPTILPNCRVSVTDSRTYL